MEWCCFRRVRGGAIVRIVRVSGAVRARLVTAVLSLALIYAFTCSANCANCFRASGAAETQSQACGHAAPDAGGGAQQQAPAKPDCSGHHRFGFDVMQSDGLSRVEWSATYATQLFHGAVRMEVVNVGASFLSDLAPPRDDTVSPQRRISVLRI